EAGAKRHAAIENGLAGFARLVASGNSRIENQQNAALVFAGKLAHLQLAGPRRSLPINVARAVGSLVLPDGIKIVAAPPREAFELARHQRKDLVELLARSYGRVNQ